METVLRRGPWAFNDRMLVIQRWEPQLPLINFIPFWTQIRGIPVQFLNRGVVEHIGCALGQVLEVDFDADAIARVDFARVLLHWDITQPLHFQRNFQFSDGGNTFLRFRYERLRGFCEVCGMLTHDSGACLILDSGVVPRVIRELNDDEPMDMNQIGADVMVQGEAGNQNDAEPDANNDAEDSEEEKLSDIDPNHDSFAMMEVYEHHDMFSEERNNSELFNPVPIYENSCGDISGSPSHIMYTQAIHPLALMDSEAVINPEAEPMMDRGKRKREDYLGSSALGDAKIMIHARGESSGSSSEPNHCRGAVGPKPPQPP